MPREQQNHRNSFRVGKNLFLLFTQGFKANPGLKLANAFSVILNIPWFALFVFLVSGSTSFARGSLVCRSFATAPAQPSIVPADDIDKLKYVGHSIRGYSRFPSSMSPQQPQCYWISHNRTNHRKHHRADSKRPNDLPAFPK